MIERHLIPALDYWAAQPLEERKKMLAALQADESMADHDFAGLPPQVWAGIAAGLQPPASEGAGGRSPTTEAAAAGDEDDEHKTRRKR